MSETGTEASETSPPAAPSTRRSDWRVHLVAGAAAVAILGSTLVHTVRDLRRLDRQPFAGRQLANRLLAAASVIPEQTVFEGQVAPTVVQFWTYPETFGPYAKVSRDATLDRRATHAAVATMLAQQLMTPRFLTVRELSGIPHYVLGFFDRAADVPRLTVADGYEAIYRDPDGLAVWRARQ